MYFNWADLEWAIFTILLQLARLRIYSVEGPVLLSLLFIITEKINAMFSRVGLGPIHFTLSY